MSEANEALEYHRQFPAGKLEVNPTKPFLTQRDLSLAYSPGVAEPCREIAADPDTARLYTARGNLVAVVTNGSAVLGLGNIGALASKPVMEGKAILFKRFADVDAFDIELDTQDVNEIIRAVQLMAPTFGAVNLEDIAAPECFAIEEALRETMPIPVFHDDQHGTAIVSGAALLNALELTGKPIDQVRVVYTGAGAAGLACAAFHEVLGVRPEHRVVCDSRGVIYHGRDAGMNEYKQRVAIDTDLRTLEEAMEGADVFMGLSGPGTMTPAMLKTMAPDPLVFAMANPDPEIPYGEAIAARPDAIVATGRSDFPNQINNVLAFPAIFRGALDAHASGINEEMKAAAAHTLAHMVREETPDQVLRAYGMDRLRFGREYILPKPFDPRVVVRVAHAVAAAAMKTGVAGRELDLDAYARELELRLGQSRQAVQVVLMRAATDPKRIVFPEGDQPRVLRACRIVAEEGIAHPIVIGREQDIAAQLAELGYDDDFLTIVDPADSREAYVDELFRLRQRKGLTREESRELLTHRHYLGPMMVRMGDADGLVGGLLHKYADTVRPALQTIGLSPDARLTAGAYMMVFKSELMFFADPVINIDPSAEELAEIAICTAEMARSFDVEPRVAMLSFSNFGSSRHPHADKVRQATQLVRERAPDLVVEGEMQADLALVPAMMEEAYPFAKLVGRANVLVFPNLSAANVAYKLVQVLAGAEAVGPILMGFDKPVHLMPSNTTVEQIVQLAAVAVVDAQQGGASK
ncbi:MAG: NADP-dependent malic enzyme [Gemmatimonadetes bacterium]|jgi:malate dehydrogenase (oxaloacetate-decarboxylating)(NADP+)|nr:NADP-dependent malic enzyme [Gemmatimonadota bacterium]